MQDSTKVYCPSFGADKDLMLLPLGDGVFKGEIGKNDLCRQVSLFPQSEETLSFMGNRISKVTDSTSTLVFGIRPCEMRAIQFTDRFMTGTASLIQLHRQKKGYDLHGCGLPRTPREIPVSVWMPEGCPIWRQDMTFSCLIPGTFTWLFPAAKRGRTPKEQAFRGGTEEDEGG